MKTYLKLILHSEGASPQQVVSVLKKFGFEPAIGIHDLEKNWGKEKKEVAEILDFIEKVHESLKGLNVSYEITTI
ncbi:MAG: hypothetical protein QW728_06325 [Thermoplasmata archaeon]